MATKKSAPLDPKVADKLLDLLSTDNEFRRLFKKDPRAALIKAGMSATKDAAALEAVAGCCQVARIAPKADVIRARKELQTMFIGGLGQNPPQLDLGVSAARRIRK